MKTIVSTKKGVTTTNKDMMLHADDKPWGCCGCKR